MSKQSFTVKPEGTWFSVTLDGDTEKLPIQWGTLEGAERGAAKWIEEVMLRSGDDE